MKSCSSFAACFKPETINSPFFSEIPKNIQPPALLAKALTDSQILLGKSLSADLNSKSSHSMSSNLFSKSALSISQRL